MTVFVPSHGVRVQAPINVWREDDPSIRPTCSACRGDIKAGQSFAIAVVGNAVFCKPCATPYRVVK